VTELTDWFHQYADRYFSQYLGAMKGQVALRFLQVGCCTGDATMWLFDNILTDDSANLVDVDTWIGSPEPGDRGIDFVEVESLYDARTGQLRASGRLTKFRGTSGDWFTSLPNEPIYDFVYIDGDHSAFGVLNDAVDAYRRLKVGGILAFDDYYWKGGEGYLHDPAQAIDSYLYLYADRFAILEKSLQVWLQRTK